MKFVIFVPSGRLGNAIFRYFGCSLLCMKNNHDYILEEDFKTNDDFIFYKGLDFIGNDIMMINNDIREMKNYAKNNNKVFCFNTLGFLKDNFNSSNLISNQWINQDNGQGIYVKNILNIDDNIFFEYLNKDLKDFNLKMNGYFQFDYIKHKKEIIDYMEKNKNNHYIRCHFGPKYLIKDIIDDIDLENRYDIVIHIRLGDFKGRPDFIEYEYYERVFEIIDFKDKKICLMIDNIRNNEDEIYLNRCFDWFKNKNIEVKLESNDVLVDFNIMKQCKILVCSMSILSWASAFLSRNIEKCYMPNYNFKERDALTFKNPIENTFFYKVLTTKIDKIKSVIITLKDFPERMKNISKLLSNFQKIGLDYEIFYGVNGNEIIMQDTLNTHIKKLFYEGKEFLYNDRVRLNGLKMNKGMFGLLWSNYLIYKKLIEDKDNDYYLILEDDVELVGDLYKLKDHLLDLPDVDIINMGLSDWFPFILLGRISKYYYAIERRFFNRTTAIIISKNCARKMIGELEKGMNSPLDDMYCHYYLKNINFRYVVPERYFFCEREGNESIIDKIGL